LDQRCNSGQGFGPGNLKSVKMFLADLGSAKKLFYDIQSNDFFRS